MELIHHISDGDIDSWEKRTSLTAHRGWVIAGEDTAYKQMQRKWTDSLFLPWLLGKWLPQRIMAQSWQSDSSIFHANWNRCMGKVGGRRTELKSAIFGRITCSRNRWYQMKLELPINKQQSQNYTNRTKEISFVCYSNMQEKHWTEVLPWNISMFSIWFIQIEKNLHQCPILVCYCAQFHNICSEIL